MGEKVEVEVDGGSGVGKRRFGLGVNLCISWLLSCFHTFVELFDLDH